MILKIDGPCKKIASIEIEQRLLDYISKVQIAKMHLLHK